MLKLITKPFQILKIIPTKDVIIFPSKWHKLAAAPQEETVSAHEFTLITSTAKYQNMKFRFVRIKAEQSVLI